MAKGKQEPGPFGERLYLDQDSCNYFQTDPVQAPLQYLCFRYHEGACLALGFEIVQNHDLHAILETN